MLPIVWRPQAAADMAAIAGFIAEHSPQAAHALLERIETAVLPLSEHPYMGPAGRVAGTREVVAHPNYVVVYQVAAESVEILGVMHSRQEYP